ncbi:hypothetical protein [Nitrobacter sp.]|uniref:hypothetical protein n=1 Tax=Nitrobacter sp. TaxID=29420 RepID=UPI0032207803
MTTMTLTIDRNKRRVADHEINVQKSDRSVPTALANIITDAWMLAIYHSIGHYVWTESIVRSNAEAIAAFTYALGSTDAGDKFEEKRDDSVESFDAPSVGDLLASDRRSITCKTLGGAFEGKLTKSVRRDLILVSGVVC